MADLATFIPVRRKPAGPVETFSTERAAETVPVEIHTEDVATILLRFEDGARGSVAISQISAGRKNCSSTRSTAPPPPSPGTRSSRTSSGSVTATGRTSSCSGTRR